MATQTEYAWAAGFFDGEGCVSVSKVLRTGRKQSAYYSLSILLEQKDIRPLEHFRTIFGITDRMYVTNHTFRGKVCPMNRTVICAANAVRVLQLMLPYLTLKRDAAIAAIELQNCIDSLSIPERIAGISESELAKREIYYQQVRWHNSGRWAAATTKPSGPETGCDSLNCTDDKGAEVAETTTRLH